MVDLGVRVCVGRDLDETWLLSFSVSSARLVIFSKCHPQTLLGEEAWERWMGSVSCQASG